MLLQKLAKAKNAPYGESPRGFGASSHRHATLKVFSQLRPAESSNDVSLDEEEFAGALDQDLMRELDSPKASFTAKHRKPSINFEHADSFSGHAQKQTAIIDSPFWEKANTASTAPFASSASAFSGAEVTPLSFGKGPQKEDANLGVPEASVFSLFSPTNASNHENTSPPGIAQITPKLNAQTLFAFGAADAFSDTFSSQVSKPKAQAAEQGKFSVQGVTNPWAMNTPDLLAMKAADVPQRKTTATRLNFEDQSIKFQAAADASAVNHPFWPKKDHQIRERRGSDSASEVSSLTEEIFANALKSGDESVEAGLNSPQAQEANKSTGSFNAAVSQGYTAGTFAGDTTSTQNSSFFSGNRSDFTFEKGNKQSINAPPFKPTPMTNSSPVGAPHMRQNTPTFTQGPHSPFNFMRNPNVSNFVPSQPILGPQSSANQPFYPQNQLNKVNQPFEQAMYGQLQQPFAPQNVTNDQLSQQITLLNKNLMRFQQPPQQAHPENPFSTYMTTSQPTYSPDCSASDFISGRKSRKPQVQKQKAKSKDSDSQSSADFQGSDKDKSLFAEIPFAQNLTSDEFSMVRQAESLAFDQAGCRLMQKRLEETPQQSSKQIDYFTSSLLSVLLDMLPDVMMNQFGNYLCQKIIEKSTPSDLRKLTCAIIPSAIDLAMDVHGTRVMQTLVEVLGRNYLDCHAEILDLAAEFNEAIFDMAIHPNANHVIQAFLLTFKASELPKHDDKPGTAGFAVYTNFIFNACINYCDEIGSDKHGCCVMQRCLEKGLRSQKLALADIIVSRLHYLIEDPFGNYLVQNVLKLEDAQRNDQILNFIAGDFLRLSQEKFSSNVIEKCLETKQAANHVDQIFKGTHYWDDQVLVRELGAMSRIQSVRVNYIVDYLVPHQFGNYVLQKAIAVITDQNLRSVILESIKAISQTLQTTKHGLKVYNKLIRTYPIVFTAEQQAKAASSSPSDSKTTKHVNSKLSSGKKVSPSKEQALSDKKDETTIKLQSNEKMTVTPAQQQTTTTNAASEDLKQIKKKKRTHRKRPRKKDHKELDAATSTSGDQSASGSKSSMSEETYSKTSPKKAAVQRPIALPEQAQN